MLHRAIAVVGVLVVAGVPASAVADTSEDDPTGLDLKPNQIITVAGTPESGYSGDGWHARDARLGDRLNISLGSDGTVYIADIANDRLRAVDGDGIIDTVAGTRARRSPQRDVPVAEGWTFSPRNTPHAVAAGQNGALYVAASETIYRIEPDGRPEVIGGNGDESFSDGGDGGDGGPAVDAWIYQPSDIAVDADGNVYVADGNNQRIRKIATDGTITTIAGGGERPPLDAVDGPATEASTPDVQALAVDSQGTVYFSQENGRPGVWKVDSDGVLSVAAGTGIAGFDGDGGPADQAKLSSPPSGLAVDAGDNLYLTDTDTGHVRRVDTDGVITTVGPAFTAMLGGRLDDVAVGPDGDLYVAVGPQVRMLVQSVEDPGPAVNGTPPRVGPDPWADEEPGTLVTVAGNGEEPTGQEADAIFGLPISPEPPPRRSVAVNADGSLLYADPARHQVLSVDAAGTVRAVAGTGGEGISGDGGPAADATLSRPSAVTVDASGTLYIADTGNSRIRAVDSEGVITTVAGSRAPGYDENPDDVVLGDGGAATDAMLIDPQDVAVSADGSLYIADGRGERIRMVDASGTISTLAGGGDLWAQEADGEPATNANLWEPNAVAVDANGTVYFTGQGMPWVRKVDPKGTLTTVAGNSYLEVGEGGFDGDGGPGTKAELNTPRDLAIGPHGALYIADTFNSRVRRVDADGVITTVVGTGERRDSGDDGQATEAAINEPDALAFDAEGALYVAGAHSGRVRRVDPDGVISTVADLAATPARTKPQQAIRTPFGSPGSLAIAQSGALHVMESSTGGPVRRIDPDGAVSTVRVDEHLDGGVPLHANAVAYGTDGSLYVAVSGAVKRLYPDGAMVTVAGGGVSAQPPDEARSPTSITLSPTALAAGPSGSVYIADAQHGQIFKLDQHGRLTKVAKDERAGGGLLASGGTGLAVDRQGAVYIADPLGDVVRRVAPDGTASVFAGNGEPWPLRDDDGDGGPATEAVVSSPDSVAVGDDGNVYVSTSSGIRRVDSEGTITTVLEQTEGEDGAPLPGMQLTALAIDAHGNVYFSDLAQHRVRVLVRPSEISSGASPASLVAAGAIALLLTAGGVIVWRRRRAADAASAGDHPTAPPTPADAGARSSP